jgi:hypothetical protein
LVVDRSPLVQAVFLILRTGPQAWHWVGLGWVGLGRLQYRLDDPKALRISSIRLGYFCIHRPIRTIAQPEPITKTVSVVTERSACGCSILAGKPPTCAAARYTSSIASDAIKAQTYDWSAKSSSAWLRVAILSSLRLRSSRTRAEPTSPPCPAT